MCAARMKPVSGGPLLSVLMGVLYRREDTALLRRSVQSIVSQTYPCWELLICDDGSAEAARQILEAFAERDPRIRLIRPGGLYGLAGKLNACLGEAKGTWIARMDDDDRSHPERFQKQLAFLEAHPDLAFVGSSAALWRGGVRVGVRVLPEYPLVEDFLFTQPFIHPALLFRREALLAAGGYSEDKRCVLCEDYDLLLRLYGQGMVGANLRECLLDYTLPENAKGHRRMVHRWNEAVTRWRRFRALGLLPGALPYVVKPIAAGLLPAGALRRAQQRHIKEP